MESQAMKTTSMQDSAYQALSAQKNPRKKSGLFETTSARKLQTSFPPIHFSLSTPSRTMYKSCKDHVSNLDVSRDIQGQKINLPQVEKPSEKISAPIQSITAVDKRKVTADHSRYLRARSNTVVVPFRSTREIKLENKSGLNLPSSKIASEGLSAETYKVPECPNCKKERRIQNEYDKFILQSKRDKEALQKTIVKLEAELKRYEEHHKPAQGQESEVTCSVEERQPLRGEVSLDGLEGMCKNELAYMRSRSDMNKLEEESKGKQQQMDSLLVEMEELKAQLQRIQNNEEKQAQMTKMKQSKLVLEMEELKSQLEETKERERQKVSVLENEKDACLKEIAEMKTCIEKMSTENSSLMEKMKALENRSSCCCLASVVHGNAEILTISHHSTFSVDAESPHCFNSCGGATCNSGTQSSKCVAGTSSVEDDEIRMKEMYKQLKRERNLLLDVMLLMYTRRWFLEEAIPYIRRTLRKCGVNSEDRNWNSDLLSSQNTGFNVIAHSRVCSCFRRFVYTAIRQAWLVHVGLWGSGIRGCLIVMETFGLWLQPELWDPSTSQGPRASVPAKCLCQN
ncbi:uncharacterized protein LOC115649174 isoform X2 [Gopherus evgoodei]|uniref:uncharacterized protein LOC115649174 isoform X2 n=1 Tax=Gopherus evgoodei TaxID=1825980 RepID=UPI0011CF439B|nr:uncharacterized protein LOC115649174 isoform X2 [Gopherus evgoodei]